MAVIYNVILHLHCWVSWYTMDLWL